MHPVDRIIAWVERVAGAFLAVVTALTFVSVVLRYGFDRSIPDSYDLSRNFLGILIFWGIAVTGWRGDHITVELLYGALPRRARHALDLLGTLFALCCMGVFAWAMGHKVLDERASGEQTYDLHLAVWPFYLLAWLGIAVGTLLLAVRLLRQLREPPAEPAADIQISH
jgi:TRAP-type C4-dicarboxylate transport system permease small subunit